MENAEKIYATAKAYELTAERHKSYKENKKMLQAYQLAARYYKLAHDSFNESKRKYSKASVKPDLFKNTFFYN